MMATMAAAHSMTGKTVLITGGTSGIGRAAAIGLATMGARVGIAGRDRARAEAAAAEIARASGNPAVDVFVADMAGQSEVRRLADEVLATYPRLDVLLNNVGGFWAHRHVTADGLERTFALNHLAPFLLTSLLLERLIASAPARVVTVSSGAQSLGKIDFDDLMGERRYSGQRAYNQSKLANVMFTYELARRLEGTGVTATALHPGVTRTGFGAEDPNPMMIPDDDPHHRHPAPVHEKSHARRRDRYLPFELPGSRGCNWPLLRGSQGQEVAGFLIRRCDHSPTVGRQRGTRRAADETRALTGRTSTRYPPSSLPPSGAAPATAVLVAGSLRWRSRSRRSTCCWRRCVSRPGARPKTAATARARWFLARS